MRRKSPKRKKGNKADAQRKHAKRRALQRYGIACSDEDLATIKRLIKDGKGKFVERQSLRLTVWDIRCNGVVARVVYDKIRKEIVTFLPPETIEDTHVE